MYATKGKSKQFAYIGMGRFEESVVTRKIKFLHKAYIKMLSFVFYLASNNFG